MSRGRNERTTKVAESKLVLSAEFLLTTFSFDLVLNAHVFVLHSIKVLELNCFTLKYIVFISVEHLIKKPTANCLIVKVPNR